MVKDALEALAPITEQGARPTLGVVLGSGLGAFVAQLSNQRSLPYSAIPRMPRSGVAGHQGALILGELGPHGVACLAGRCHLYEGHSATEVVFGVRLLAALGVSAVLLTNAAGGIARDCAAGSLLLITDHLNLTGTNPLVAREGGPHFCDMQHAYDRELIALAVRAAEAQGVQLAQGIYAGVLGPSYETPAEIRMLAGMGASAVGMSTVLETIALRQLGVRVGAMSMITNRAAGLADLPLGHADVTKTASEHSQKFCDVLSAWCRLTAGACNSAATTLS